MAFFNAVMLRGVRSGGQDINALVSEVVNQAMVLNFYGFISVIALECAPEGELQIVDVTADCDGGLVFVAQWLATH